MVNDETSSSNSASLNEDTSEDDNECNITTGWSSGEESYNQGLTKPNLVEDGANNEVDETLADEVVENNEIVNTEIERTNKQNLEEFMSLDEEQLNMIISWDIPQLRDLFKNKLNSKNLLEVLGFFHSLQQNYKKSIDTKNKTKLNMPYTFKNVIDSRLSEIYRSWVESNIGRNKPIEFLGFLDNSYLERRHLLNHYFDKIYVLNLDRRPDRLENMEKRLGKLGIYNWVRWGAIDGSQSPHWEEWKHYMKSKMTRMEKLRYHRKAIASCGSWAILKSMYHLLRDAQDKKYNRILVLQDDDLFHKDYEERFIQMTKYIPDKKWRLLYLGGTQHNWNHIITTKNYYHPNGTADGAFAVGIHSNLYQELIDEILKFDMPVDSGALRNLQKKYVYSSYVIIPNLIIADIRDSDLRHSRDLYNFGQRFRWNIDQYEID